MGTLIYEKTYAYPMWNYPRIENVTNSLI